MNKKIILTLLVPVFTLSVTACKQMDYLQQQTHLLWRNVRQIFQPYREFASDKNIPPRPLKPKREDKTPPPYHVLNEIQSKAIPNIQRIQIVLAISKYIPKEELKYIYRELVKKYQDKIQVVWMYTFQEGQYKPEDLSNPQSPRLISKAEWFSSDVPEYRRVDITQPDEFYSQIAIQYHHR